MDRMVGSGSFGQIFMARDMTNDRDVAVKFEKQTVRKSQVVEEAKLLQELKGMQGFPQFVWYGKEGPFTIMVQEMLGPSIEDMYNYCGRKFSLKTVIMLAD